MTDVTASRSTHLRVVVSPALEAHVATLRDSLPGHQIESIDPVGALALSLESQQMDAAKKRDQEELKLEVNEATIHEKKTGPLEVFLLDSKQLAAGDAASQATLRAMAHAALNNNANIVAALLPAHKTAAGDPMSDAVHQVVTHYMDVGHVHVVTSVEALIDHLKNQ